MTVVSQLRGMSDLKEIGNKRLIFRDGNNHIDLIIQHELVDGFHEIEHADEIIFGIKFFQHFMQFCPLGFVFFR
jgi:hypothetical protein